MDGAMDAAKTLSALSTHPGTTHMPLDSLGLSMAHWLSGVLTAAEPFVLPVGVVLIASGVLYAGWRMFENRKPPAHITWASDEVSRIVNDVLGK